MPVHKCMRKPARPIPPVVRWRPQEGFSYPAIRRNERWEIFSQKALTIPLKSAVTLSLRFGVQLIRGVCSVSLRRALREKRCSSHNVLIAESVDDMIVTVRNNFDVVVSIAEEESLSFVSHQG